MSDFATALTTEAAGFSNREGRKVVVKNETFFVFATGVIVELLSFVCRSQSGDGESLGLTPSKERRAVCARQDGDFAADLAELVDFTVIFIRRERSSLDRLNKIILFFAAIFRMG